MLIPPDQPPPAVYWDTPDTDPFRGTRAEAIALLGIPAPPERLQCRLRQIGERERFDAMTFGAHSVEYDVVARPSRWPTEMPETALDCRYVADGWEYHLVYPIACGNYSFERFPIAPGRELPGSGWADTSWPGWGGAEGYSGGAGEGFGGGGYSEAGFGGYGASLSGAGYGSGGVSIPYALTPPGALPTPPIVFVPISPPFMPVPPYTPPITPPVVPTPEPGSLASLIFSLAVWAAYRWRTLWPDLRRAETPMRELA